MSSLRLRSGCRRPPSADLVVSPAASDVAMPPHEASHASRQGSVARRADRDAVGVVLEEIRHLMGTSSTRASDDSHPIRAVVTDRIATSTNNRKFRSDRAPSRVIVRSGWPWKWLNLKTRTLVGPMRCCQKRSSASVNHPFPASDDGRDHDLDDARPIRENTRTPPRVTDVSLKNRLYDAKSTATSVFFPEFAESTMRKARFPRCWPSVASNFGRPAMLTATG